MSNTPNRLLAMLNSAASASTPNPTSSPREPTPAPPVPSFQTVSLQDLFKSIAPPPPPSAQPSNSMASTPSISGNETGMPTVKLPVPAQSVTSPGAGGKAEQQNRLLGMLMNIGASQTSAAVNGGSAKPAGQTKEGGVEREKVNGQSQGQVGKQQDLLAMFKSPPSSGTALPAQPSPQPQPQSSNTTAGPPLSSAPSPQPDTTRPMASTGPDQAPDIASKPTSPPTTEPSKADELASKTLAVPASNPPRPQKSPFHFVSPFDAFEPPVSRSTSQTARAREADPAPIKQEKKKAVKHQTEEVPAVAPASITSAPAGSNMADIKPTQEELAAVHARVEKVGESSSAATASPVKKAQNGSKQSTQDATASVAAPTAETAKSDGELVWQVGKVTQGAKGTGPKNSTGNVVVDLSKPNLDSLMSDRHAVQLIPTANLKPLRETRYSRGQIVGITPGWMAYALSGGRMRLIDRGSASRVILSLPEAARTGPLIDMAVQSTHIAAVGADRSITVFRVPPSWNQDDPPCPQILHIRPSSSSQLEELNQVEWVDRGEDSLLAIGGSGGMIIFDPKKEGKETDTGALAKKHRVLSTEGDSVAFCFNHTQQAIAILSTSSTLTIYSVATSNRVFHKQLPSSSSSTPCSVQFCETNILIGRENNTIFDLVQITLNLSILSTIKIISPSPSPWALHFCQAAYDPNHAILWITPLSRGSIYGFKYALKARPPVQSGESVTVWTKMGEVALEPVTSMHVSKEQGEGMEMIFAHPKGITLGLVGSGVIQALSSEAAVDQPVQDEHKAEEEAVPEKSVMPAAPAQSDTNEIETPQPDSQHEQARKGPDAQTAQGPSKVMIVDCGQSVQDRNDIAQAQPQQDAPSVARSASTAPVQIPPRPTADLDDEPVIVEKASTKTSEDTTKQLKKMEDRIVTQLRQALSAQIGNVNHQLESLAGDKMASDIAVKVEKQVKGTLTNTVKEEIKKSVLPAITKTTITEIHASLPSLVPSAINESLRQTVPQELERIIAPLVQQTVNKVVQQSLGNAIGEAMKRLVVPAVVENNTRLIEGLAADLRSEMVQLRKDLSPPSNDRNDHALKTMAESIIDLRRQLSTLSEQIRSIPPPPPPMPHHPPAGPMANPYPLAPAPPAQPKELEDTFLSALSSPSTQSTLNLVNDHYSLTDYCLPLHSAKSPLSQAVILTLFHRLALALAELNPQDPMFQRVITWERRVVGLLDPRAAEMRDFYPRVVEVVRNTLGGVIMRVGEGGAGRAVREILDVVAQKQ